eukprot:gene6326-2950_t
MKCNQQKHQAVTPAAAPAPKTTTGGLSPQAAAPWQGNQQKQSRQKQTEAPSACTSSHQSRNGQPMTTAAAPS